jgi:hypothetical protein
VQDDGRKHVQLRYDNERHDDDDAGSLLLLRDDERHGYLLWNLLTLYRRLFSPSSDRPKYKFVRNTLDSDQLSGVA